MLDDIISFFVSFAPVIFAGVANSALHKSNLLLKLNVPIDGGKHLKDGARVFGDNKTYRGIIGYIVLNTVFAIIWGIICSRNSSLTQHNLFYALHSNTMLFNARVGALLGFAWALFELPNSFMKRRLNVGQSILLNGWKKYIFIVIDQADSVFGVVLILMLFYPLTWTSYFIYVLLGTASHLLINHLLYVMKLRNQPA